MGNVRASSLALLFFFVVLTCYLSYGIARYETTILIPCYIFLFALYSFVFLKEKDVNFWLAGSLIVRISLLFVLPNLSDDFYRFIWDGRLWVTGQHPFAALPADFLNQHIPGLDTSLFEKLNSKEYFTVYPPVAQFFFWLSVEFSPHSVLGSVITIRILIFLAEAGSILLMLRLLDRFQLPRKNVLLYALNPLVILELTGNLHFEAFVIFFLLLSVWLLTAEKIIPASIAFAFAIGVKLVPIIFLPLMLGVLGFRRAVTFYLVTGFTCLLFFIPLYDQQILAGFSKSLNLYFKNFEFNASLYYLVREYGFWKVGYNTIQNTGWKLGVVGSIFITTYALLFKVGKLGSSCQNKMIGDHGLFVGFLFSLLIYLSIATTVHPWYITAIAAFSVFTRFRFGFIWTALIFLTYIGYSQQGFSEELWITAFEYIMVFGYLGYELLWKENEVPAGILPL